MPWHRRGRDSAIHVLERRGCRSVAAWACVHPAPRHPTSSAGAQALAGTAPLAFASGNYAKAHKRYTCLKPLRNAPYQFAWQSTLREGWARRCYQRKRWDAPEK